MSYKNIYNNAINFSKFVNLFSRRALYRVSIGKKDWRYIMKIKKQILLLPIGLLLMLATAPSHASGSAYGKVGYYGFPFNIVVGYSGYNYGHRNYHRSYNHGHSYNKYKYKPKKHYYKYNKRHNYYSHKGHRYDRYSNRYYRGYDRGSYRNDRRDRGSRGFGNSDRGRGDRNRR